MDKVEKVCSLLDRMTKKNKEELIKEFISYDVSTHDLELKQVIADIVRYAIAKPSISSIYAELCDCQIKEELEKNQNSSSKFRKALLTEAQFRFRLIVDSGGNVKPSPTEPDPHFLIFFGKLFLKNIIPICILDDCLSRLSRTAYDARKKEDVDQKKVICAFILVDAARQYLYKTLLDEWFKRMRLCQQFLAEENRSALFLLENSQTNRWIRSHVPEEQERLIQWYLKLDSDEKLKKCWARFGEPLESETLENCEETVELEGKKSELTKKDKKMTGTNEMIYEKDQTIQKLQKELEQLKMTKSKEIEGLKMELVEIREKNDVNQSIIDNLKAENEKLREDSEASIARMQKLEVNFEQLRKYTFDGMESLKMQNKSQKEPLKTDDDNLLQSEVKKLQEEFEQLKTEKSNELELLKIKMAELSEKNDANLLIFANLKTENEMLRAVIAELPKRKSDTEILEEYAQILKPDFKSKVSAMNQELTRLAQSYPEFNQIFKAKMEISEICENVDEYIEEARKGYERIMNSGGHKKDSD